MKEKFLPFEKLELPQIIDATAHLSHVGKVGVTPTQLLYLDVVDDYIHKLYLLLKTHNPHIEKPDYFAEDGIGAHITIIYPEENTIVEKKELGQEFQFQVNGIYLAHFELKKYYVLGVESPSLTDLRKKYGLNKKLLFKNYLIDMHITIGTCPIAIVAD